MANNLYSSFISSLIAKAEVENSGGGSAGLSDQIVFTTRSSFPEIGKAKVLYVATDECKAYLYSEQSSKYECINGDSTDIGVIKSIL